MSDIDVEHQCSCMVDVVACNSAGSSSSSKSMYSDSIVQLHELAGGNAFQQTMLAVSVTSNVTDSCVRM
jgi:hypothetical protein